ncbi:uncharacterized protein F5147DRAFT_648114 [Suillus discolor]|uniref:Uncharacterized protein n=1 Tax=Suillus discolor TaxID=1912936 RepID=A0A9P7K0L6_9AGAM|nr:uncharacterized protein F5147DRAFT_648114 [Suillus discolor]KAG2119034.1 hypothetical protein F5147DRAFT_648114 [Suillus discolor]
MTDSILGRCTADKEPEGSPASNVIYRYTRMVVVATTEMGSNTGEGRREHTLPLAYGTLTTAELCLGGSTYAPLGLPKRIFAIRWKSRDRDSVSWADITSVTPECECDAGRRYYLNIFALIFAPSRDHRKHILFLYQMMTEPWFEPDFWSGSPRFGPWFSRQPEPDRKTVLGSRSSQTVQFWFGLPEPF